MGDDRIVVLLADGVLEGVFETPELAKQFMERHNLSEKDCEWHEPYFYKSDRFNCEINCRVYIRSPKGKYGSPVMEKLTDGVFVQKGDKLILTFEGYLIEVFPVPPKLKEQISVNGNKQKIQKGSES